MGDDVLQRRPVTLLKRVQRYCFCLFIAMAVAGCASTPVPRCASGEQAVVLDTLYLGTATPEGVVTAEEWNAFLDQMVVPDFPEGLTSWAATGRWGNSTGLVERESSNLLQLAHNGSYEKDRAVLRIADRYKSRFHQVAVMRLRSRACRTF